MKRAIVLTLVFLIFLSSCGASDDVEIDFGESDGNRARGEPPPRSLRATRADE